MMITIHGLPITAKYHDLKILIKQQCNISDFILDSLVSEVDGTKKVRVGLTDDGDGSHLLKCLDGFRFGGNILRLVPVGKSSITQQPNSFDARGTYQQSDYSNQNINERNRTLDAARPTNWVHNQWSSNQPQLVVQNNYGYQQPATISYGPTNNMVKPHFEPRDVIQSSRVPSQSQHYSYNPKSNLISLGPQSSIPSTLRELPQATSRLASARYQSYDTPSEKPITIMKENFQGPNQYNLTSSLSQSSYQSQGPISTWTAQAPQQKSFEKPLPMFDRKPYDERKYSSQTKQIQDPSKLDDSYKYDRSGQSYSPQRKDFRDMEERSRTYKAQYSDRRTPERRMSPSNRNVPSSSRHYSPSRQMSPSGRHVIPTGRHSSPPGRHVSSTGRHISPSSRHAQHSIRQSSPPSRHATQSGRHPSPPSRYSPRSNRLSSPSRQAQPAGRISSGRYGSPPSRNVGPAARHVSPAGRHGSPSGRQSSPSDRHIQMKVRQMSPNRQIPTERKISPSGKMFPLNRNSPHLRKEEYVRGRRVSPPSHSSMDRRTQRQSLDRDAVRGVPSHTRHVSPRRQGRFTSPQRMDQKQVQYQDDHRSSGIKDIRPAYEPQVQAPNEAMYSGGYRPNVREEAIKYQSRSEHWKERENFSSKTNIEDRRESSRMQKFDIPRSSERPRSTEQEANRSRSPKRDRSPLRDRFKRHSPSPRSPRRSWALEKRRSPETREPPPPPVWPQEKEEYTQQARVNYSEKDMEKTSPIWLPREKSRDTFQNSDDRRNFSDQRRSEVGKWKPIPGSSPQPSSSSRFEEPKPARKDFENQQEFIRNNESRKVYPERHEKQYHQARSDIRYKSGFDTKDEIPRKRDEFSGRIEEKKKEILLKQEQLQKEIDEVYKRAVDFTKKAEMYRKGEIKREGNYDDDRHHSENRSNPKEIQRFKRDSYEKDINRDNFHKDYKKLQYSRDDDRKSVHEDLKDTRHGSDDSQKRNISKKGVKGVRFKRAKIVEDISDTIMTKHGKFLSGEMKKRVTDELKWTLERKLQEMFGDSDDSILDMAVKFQEKYTSKDLENIFKDVMFSLPNHYRNMKRHAQDDSEIPAKSSRRSSESSASKDLHSRAMDEKIVDWNINAMQRNAAVNHISMINASLIASLTTNCQRNLTHTGRMEGGELSGENKKDSVLYLCKDDFQPILEHETVLLKDFLIQKMIKVTQTSRGWAPDFTLNRQLNSDCRHEVLAGDERSKEWLSSLDFSEFKYFNVLVYNTEELWYERAAIWLPGHSRSRGYDPLTKLKLQNKHLEGVNIGKWKAVKSIVTEKGTRLYVDMPPSSARALEKYNKLLSYELQKVNVFLKAVAVDKNAFDAGLNEPSLSYIPPGHAASMPSVGEHPDLVKLALRGNKPFTLPMAKKLKDIILYKLFKYHELGGPSKTDFVKYGVFQGRYFGIIPENEESKRWLCSLDMGKIQHQQVFIMGADGVKTKYFKMEIYMPRDYKINAALACERIRHSNQGVKGLNFSLWKNPAIVNDSKRKKTVLEIDMDLESVETLLKLNFQLDYLAKGTNYGQLTVVTGYSVKKLRELIATYKEEMKDSYVVSNMELATDSDEEVVCLD